MDNADRILNSFNCPVLDNALNIESYNEEGKKDLRKLANIIDEMDNFLSVEDMKLIKDVIDHYHSGGLILFKMLETKIDMIESTKSNNAKSPKYGRMGARLRPLLEND